MRHQTLPVRACVRERDECAVEVAATAIHDGVRLGPGDGGRLGWTVPDFMGSTSTALIAYWWRGSAKAAAGGLATEALTELRHAPAHRT